MATKEAAMKRDRSWTIGAAVLAAFTVVAGSPQQPPAPSSSKEALAVVEKMVAALGGRKALEAVKDMTVTGTAELVQFGITAPLTIYEKRPDKIRRDITIAEANMTFVQAFDGRKGWMTDPQSGAAREMPEALAKEMAREAAVDEAILHPAKAGVAYALKPKAAIEGRDYIVLEQTQPDGHKLTLYLDPQTYLPYKTESRMLDLVGAEVESETYSTNYQKTAGGLVVPYAVRIVQNGSDAERVTIASVTINTNLDDALFILK
jgi:hypothetical protein